MDTINWIVKNRPQTEQEAEANRKMQENRDRIETERQRQMDELAAMSPEERAEFWRKIKESWQNVPESELQ